VPLLIILDILLKVSFMNHVNLCGRICFLVHIEKDFCAINNYYVSHITLTKSDRCTFRMYVYIRNVQ